MQFKTAYSDKPKTRLMHQTVVEDAEGNKSLTNIERPLRIRTENNEQSMTKQNLIDQADINKLIKSHGVTHIVQNANALEALYGIEITSMDLQDAQQMIYDAEKLFNEVPSELRKKFGNDAGAFIDYATNPDNLSEMQKMGLAPPPPPTPEPLQVEVVNPEQTPTE